MRNGCMIGVLCEDACFRCTEQESELSWCHCICSSSSHHWPAVCSAVNVQVRYCGNVHQSNLHW
jgi:hypothetical protein